MTPPTDPIGRVAEAVAAFGLVDREAITAHTEAWRRRPPGMATVDEDEEVELYVHSLVQAGLIEPGHASPLLALVQGPTGRGPDDPLVGRAFGDYVTVRKIGEGGMGRVYLAHRRAAPGADPRPDRCVVKVLHDDGEFEDDRRRFEQERQLLQSLVSPYIVKTLGGGVDGRLHYLLLEYVDGPTLQDVVERRGALPWEVATRYVRQVGLALATAHVMGVIHRDVKPQNVLIDRAGTLKLCDFGVAKLVGQTFSTEAGEIIGSPAYIAPEQWGDHRVDHRADLFALGVLYYLLLTGGLPFTARSPAEFAVKIQAGDYAPVDRVRRGVPAGVRQIVDQLLERDRRFRTPTAHALIVDLDRALRGEAPDVPRLEPASDDAGPTLPLVGAGTFRIGSDPRADHHLDGPNVPARVAEVLRTASGFRLRPLGPLDLNARQAKEEVNLKPGDTITFAPGWSFVLRDGNLGGGGLGDQELLDLGADEDPEGGARQPPRVVPALLAEALTEAGHPTALLGCFEALDETTGDLAIRSSGATLQRLGLPRHDSQRVAIRAQYLWRKRAVWVANQLFLSTHENYGVRLADWLRWWSEVGHRYPLQVRPPGPRGPVHVQVTPPKGGGAPYELDLPAGEGWVLGRSRDCDLTLGDQAVSRRHVRLDRLVTTLALRDLGSRQGTRVWGKRYDLGLLQSGDELEVGWTRLRIAFGPPGPSEARTVDLSTFRALAELRSPMVLRGLIELLDEQAIERACLGAGAGDERLADAAGPLAGLLLDLGELARRALSEVADGLPGTDAAAWRDWLARQEGLPPQVTPHGWFDG